MEIRRETVLSQNSKYARGREEVYPVFCLELKQGRRTEMKTMNTTNQKLLIRVIHIIPVCISITKQMTPPNKPTSGAALILGSEYIKFRLKCIAAWYIIYCLLFSTTAVPGRGVVVKLEDYQGRNHAFKPCHVVLYLS